jgi:regulator of sigma E protease
VSFESIANTVTGIVYPAFLVVFFFGLTIFVHELGHFWMARRRGMKIERFSIGFGPKIFGWKRDGIEYRLSWLPFGGYVTLPQMSPAEVIEGKPHTPAAQLPPAPPSSKILVAFAGPLMNVALAVVLACAVWYFGLPVPVNPSVVGWVDPGSVEEQMGIRPGDRIVRVNDREVKTWMEIQRVVALSREPTVRLLIERDGQQHEYLLETELNPLLGIKTINLYSRGRPYVREVFAGSAAERAGLQRGDRFLAVEGVPVSSAEELRDLVAAQTDKPTELKLLRRGRVITVIAVPQLDPTEKVGRLGVRLGEELDYEVLRPGPTPPALFADILRLMGDTVYALVHSEQTGVGARSLSGPVGIVGGWWYEIIHGGVRRGMWFAVLLNINLAILNLLPVPVLDGGHIIFSVIEAVRRKPLNARLVHATSVAFAVLLITFMLYITVFDFQRFFGSRLKLPVPPPAEVAPQPSPLPEP